ncbi:transposase IS3/IS911 family protein [Desulfitobacterium hafniense DCB-2]|uniref:Transposase IS3/IS911 family protein n=1 Tax=Desulfitobacterium hafniense (strain DSM 10664 / DCB-2) TaxID=272564 RepID=B8FNX3_DESHD|nr:transposase IS3/IS911 family protein [Desulfitobacterium hafniense DCB-2]ACL21196.1 transposase IS3/IS911 family protein [Desulfitobacterium hafniense DCB-2]ACL21949.1 transposase IS3/IS911 family protein [Desulfitobacterium hafniense DCB-2]
MSKNGKRYNQEFKHDIIRLITEENRSVSSVVQDFGVNEQTVRNWLKQTKERQDPIKTKIAELEAELKARDKKIADQELTIDILKKGYRHLRPKQPEIIYQMIKKASSSSCPVEKMCETLEVSRSGYYDWDRREPSKRQKENETILKVMKESHTKAQAMIGLDKLWSDVKEAGFQCGRNRVYRLQKQHGLYSVRKKPYRVCLTDSNHDLPKAPNLLNQKFKVEHPNKVWVTDITEFKTAKGSKLYLAAIKDLFHKEIVGWALAEHMRTELCLEALRNAVKRHRPLKGLIHHSDQGRQYCSTVYVEELKHWGMIRSMSRKGNPFDNACAESFFSTIKSERLHHKTYKDIEEARRDIFWYIECFYNRQRRHQALGNLTPAAFLKKHCETQKAA